MKSEGGTTSGDVTGDFDLDGYQARGQMMRRTNSMRNVTKNVKNVPGGESSIDGASLYSMKPPPKSKACYFIVLELKREASVKYLSRPKKRVTKGDGRDLDEIKGRLEIQIEKLRRKEY